MSARTREADVCVPVYPQLDIEPVSASGVFMQTADGRQIMDLYGGHAVAALGYGHPALSKAVADQAASMIFQSNAVALSVRARAAEQLVEFAPENIDRVFFVNSGAEANENALRMAFLTTGRRKVVALEHGFHGRSAAASAVTWGSAESWYGFPHRPFDVSFVPRNNAAAAEAAIDDSVAAVIAEPVQGVAGAFDLDADFLRKLSALARTNGALFIADEVQSGMGRSGRAFAIERLGATADIITSAKSLGGGFPCGAVLANDRIAAEMRPGDLGSTFGGGPVAARAISAVIETIKAEDLMRNVREREHELRALAGVGPVEAVQGLGLLIGLRCSMSAKLVRDKLLDHNFLTGTSSDPEVLRLLPPLTLGAEHVEQFADALKRI